MELLADRPMGVRPEGAPTFRCVIPLLDLIGGVLQVGTGSKRAQELYFKLLQMVGSEFHTLLEAPLEEISAASTPLLARAIGEMRLGEVDIDPGYDGKFGTVSVLPLDR